MKKILACVTVQVTCKRLISHAADLLTSQHDQLFVIHVAKKGADLLGNTNDGTAIDYLYNAAKQYGGEMTILRSTDVFITLRDFIKEHKITTVVLGESGTQYRNSDLIPNLQLTCPKVEFIVLPYYELQEEIV